MSEKETAAGLGMTISKTGIAVKKGETIDLHAIYDNTEPHARVMSIMGSKRLGSG